MVELDPGRRRQDEREVRLGRADQEVPAAAQGARPRGRRADRHPEAEARSDRSTAFGDLVESMLRDELPLVMILALTVRGTLRPDARPVHPDARPWARPGLALRPRRARLRARSSRRPRPSTSPRGRSPSSAPGSLAAAHRLGDPGPVDGRQHIRRLVLSVAAGGPARRPCSGLVIERLVDPTDDRRAAVLDRRDHARPRGGPAHDRLRRRQPQPAQPGDPVGLQRLPRRRGVRSPGPTSRSTSRPRSSSSRSSSSSAHAWASRCGPSPSTRRRRSRRASPSGEVFAVAWGVERGAGRHRRRLQLDVRRSAPAWSAPASPGSPSGRSRR